MSIQSRLAKLEKDITGSDLELVVCLGEYDADGNVKTYYQPRPANHARNGIYVDLSDFEDEA